MINDYGFDANGNWLGVPGPNNNLINTWNVENQLISNGSVDYSGNLITYTYDPWGKRVLQYSVGGVSGPTGTLYFYSITGQRLGTYRLNYLVATQTSVNMYFGGRLLAAVDRLGSVRGNGNGPIAYFPWGEEEKQSTGYTTPDGTDKYATYFRDGTINGAGQDYANARYYNNNFGRFWSADRAGHADLADPQSWNQYAYTKGDPVNFNDAGGTGDCAVGQPIPCTENVTGTSDDNSDDGEFVFAPSGLCIFSTLTLGCPVGDSNSYMSTKPKQTIPALDGGSKGQNTAFKDAFKDALKRLKGDCLTLIGADAIDTMDDATWQVGLIPDSRSASGFAPNAVAAATDTDTQTVTINLIGGFVAPTQTIDGVTLDMLASLRALVPGASTDDLRAFVLLHETAHLTGALGPDRDNQPLADAFNKKIAQDCFK